ALHLVDRGGHLGAGLSFDRSLANSIVEQPAPSRGLQGEPAQHRAPVDHHRHRLRGGRDLGGHGAPRGDRQAVRMKAYLWLVMMLVWLGALLGGLWWIWPHVSAREPPRDLFIGLAWLVTGGAAWLLALNLGVARYWRRRGPSRAARRTSEGGRGPRLGRW